MRSLPFSLILSVAILLTTGVSGAWAQSGSSPSPALPQPEGEKALKASPALPTSGTAAANKPLTIDDAVALALSVNRDLALAVQSLSQAQGNTTSTRATLGPTLSAGYTLNRYNQAQTSNIGGQSITIQNQYVSQLTASLNLPLDITGVLHAATSQAQFQEIAARLDVNRVRNEVVYNVKTAFYNVLRNQALVKVSENNLQNAVDRLADAKLRLEAGTVARYDVLSAQTDMATAQKTLIQNRTTLSVSLSTLNTTMGIAVNTPLQVTTTGAVQVPEGSASPTFLPTPTPQSALTENTLTGQEGQQLGDAGAARANQVTDFVVSDPLSTASEDFDTLLAEALKSRPEILREDANIAAAKKGVTVARQSVLPSTSLGYGYSYNPNAGGLGGQQQSGQATLSVSIPLFDAGQARGRVRTANAQVAAAETSRRTQVDAVTLDVRQAYLNLQQAREQITATRQALAQADEAYRLARLRYSAGVTKQSGISPLIELSNAQLSLNQAQSDYVNALYDFNNYRAALDKALGRYSQSNNQSAPGAEPTPRS